MPSQMMVPPADGSRSTVGFDGRTYSSTPRNPINIPSYDVALLQANGWSLYSGPASESIYARLRRKRLTAKTGNRRLLNQISPLIGSVPWVTGTTYTAGQQVSNGGIVYQATNSATSGPTAPTGYTTPNDGGVTWQYIGPQTAPVISFATTDPGTIENVFNFQANPASFTVYGANPVPDPALTTYTQFWNYTSLANSVVSTLTNPTRIASVWKVEFETDGTMVRFVSTNNQGPNIPFRFTVDGQYASFTPQLTTNATQHCYVTLDFTNCGARRRRTISVESIYAQVFQEIHVAATETVAASDRTSNIRACFIGDSITASTGAAYTLDGWVYVMSDYLGIADVWGLGIGGTGLMATNSGANYTFGQHLFDATNPIPDLIFINGFINDYTGYLAGTWTLSQVQAALVTAIGTIRSSMASVPLFVVCSDRGSGTVNTLSGAQAFEMALLATVRGIQQNDPNLFAIPMQTLPAGPMFTGTGYSGHATGDGNNDVYCYTDAIHLTQAGHEFKGRYVADLVAAAISNTTLYP